MAPQTQTGPGAPPEPCEKEPHTPVALAMTAGRRGDRVWKAHLARLPRSAVWPWLRSGLKRTDMCHGAF